MSCARLEGTKRPEEESMADKKRTKQAPAAFKKALVCLSDKIKLTKAARVFCKRFRPGGFFSKISASAKTPASVKGQTAIFLLLIFQILFVLFAVSLNVALTVHDKINLQNAVDLGAYYGAKKQAEVLNAIAHINFQMRQNYKLLAWRYRILGTATVMKGLGPGANKWCVWRKGGAGQTLDLQEPTAPPGQDACENSYVFCVSADLWDRGIKPGDQSLCENMGLQVEPIQNVPVIAPFVPTNLIASRRQRELQRQTKESCACETFINWAMVQALLTHFRLDQKDRKMMIHAIYNASLKDGKGLDGQSIEDKVKQIIKFNLTQVNQSNFASADMTVYNPLEGKNIEDFLEPYDIYHQLQYMRFDDDCNASPDLSSRFSSSPPPPPPSPSTACPQFLYWKNDIYVPWFSFFAKNSASQPAHEKFINPLVVSYKKKADLDIYYSVSVSLTHSRKQIFAPEPDLELKASAFAMPFGGRIGPDSLDPLIEAGRGRRPNYSRYPGDPLGLVDSKAHGILERSVHGMDSLGSYLQKNPNIGLETGWPFFNVRYYLDGLGRVSGIADPLVYTKANPSDPPPDPFHPMRLMEIMAVSPNLYDIQNYTILNNYKDSYFPHICTLITNSSDNSACNDASPPVRPDLVEGEGAAVRSPGPLQGAVRGDFGHPYLDEYEGKNLSVAQVSSFVPFFFFPPGGPLAYQEAQPDADNRFFSQAVPPYLVRDPAHFLTGFGLPNYPDRYETPNKPDEIKKMFMKCYQKTQQAGGFMHAPYGCAVGGRAGYSVRMLSCEEVSGFSNKPNDDGRYCKPRLQ